MFSKHKETILEQHMILLNKQQFPTFSPVLAQKTFQVMQKATSAAGVSHFEVLKSSFSHRVLVFHGEALPGHQYHEDALAVAK